MSFRAAYSDFRRNGNSSSFTRVRGRGLRDLTPEEEKKKMDEYYIRMRNWTPSNGRK